MLIFCQHHNANHHLTGSSVERIVYTLTAWLLDSEPDETAVRQDWVCPMELLASSTHIEEYGEFTDEMVRLRKTSRTLPGFSGKQIA